MSRFLHTLIFICDHDLDKETKRLVLELLGRGYKLEDIERKVVQLDGEPCEGC